MMTTRAPLLIGLAITTALMLAACSAGAAPTPPPTTLPPDAPVTSPPDGGVIDPSLPQPQFVVPKPGQLNVRPVSIAGLTPLVDGRNVTIRADWVSGIEPCYVLDHVDWSQDGTTITVALFEGSSDLNVACIEIAAYKATLIELGQLDPGAYTVQSADGSAPPASLTVE